MNGIPKGLCSFGQVKGDSLQCKEMSEGQRGPDTISVALQVKASLKLDVEDAVPYNLIANG